MGWYVFLGVILFLLFLLMMHVTLVIKLDSTKAFLSIRYLFFKIKLVPGKDKKPSKQIKQPKAEKTTATTDVAQNCEESTENDIAYVIKIMSTISDILAPVGKAIMYFLSKIKIRDLRFNFTFGTDDAAQTGIYYGQAMAISSQLYNLLDGLFDFEYDEMAITPRFGETVMDYSLYTKVMIRPMTFLIVGKKVIVPVIKVFLATKQKEGDKK